MWTLTCHWPSGPSIPKISFHETFIKPIENQQKCLNWTPSHAGIFKKHKQNKILRRPSQQHFGPAQSAQPNTAQPAQPKTGLLAINSLCVFLTWAGWAGEAGLAGLAKLGWLGWLAQPSQPLPKHDLSASLKDCKTNGNQSKWQFIHIQKDQNL